MNVETLLVANSAVIDHCFSCIGTFFLKFIFSKRNLARASLFVRISRRKPDLPPAVQEHRRIVRGFFIIKRKASTRRDIYYWVIARLCARPRKDNWLIEPLLNRIRTWKMCRRDIIEVSRFWFDLLFRALFAPHEKLWKIVFFFLPCPTRVRCIAFICEFACLFYRERSCSFRFLCDSSDRYFTESEWISSNVFIEISRFPPPSVFLATKIATNYFLSIKMIKAKN